MITPVRADDLLSKVKDKLNVSGVTDLLGGEHIYETDGDALNVPFPSTDENGFAARILLMMVEPQSPFEYLDKSIPIIWNVRTDVKVAISEDGNGDNPKIFLTNLQQVIFSKLQEQNVTLSHAKQLRWIWRTNNPINTLYEKSEGFYYKASRWSIILTSMDN